MTYPRTDNGDALQRANRDKENDKQEEQKEQKTIGEVWSEERWGK